MARIPRKEEFDVGEDPYTHYSNRVILVTGASSGIGRAVAMEFASGGAKVALVARQRACLEAVAAEVSARGGEALVIPMDVAERSQVEKAVQMVWEQCGRLDVLVNNAGYFVYGSVEDSHVEDFERQVTVNYLGVVYFTKAVLPLMRRQGFGAIVNVLSISGRIYLPFNSAYQASKAALRAFTLTLHRELADSSIHVSLISPGRTRTGIVQGAVRRGRARGRPLLGEMPPERVTKIVAACAERPRREVILPFALRPLALAYSVAPELVEQWLPWIQIRWARGLLPLRQRDRQD